MTKPVLGHRIVLAQRIGVKQGEVDAVLTEVLGQVPVPTEKAGIHA